MIQVKTVQVKTLIDGLEGDAKINAELKDIKNKFGMNVANTIQIQMSTTFVNTESMPDFVCITYMITYNDGK